MDKRRSAHNVSEVMNLIGDVRGKVGGLLCWGHCWWKGWGCWGKGACVEWFRAGTGCEPLSHSPQHLRARSSCASCRPARNPLPPHPQVAVLVDDMIDTAGTITNAAKVRGARGL